MKIKKRILIEQANSSLNHAEEKINTLVMVVTFIMATILTCVLTTNSNKLWLCFIILPSLSFIVLLYGALPKGAMVKQEINNNNWVNTNLFYQLQSDEFINQIEQLDDSERYKGVLESARIISSIARKKYLVSTISIVLIFPPYIILILLRVKKFKKINSKK